VSELEYGVSLPPEPRNGATVIVLLHGRGSDRHDLEPLARFLPPDAIVVTPQAPFSGADWGYGPGWAWYRFLGGDRPEPESFTKSQAMLGDLLSALPGELPVSPGLIALGGFSQGGTMSMGYALTHPGTVPLIINMSGFVPAVPAVRITPNSVEGMRFFWGHGTGDEMVPFSLAVAGRGMLEKAGAHLTNHDYGTDHAVIPQELRDLSDWIVQARSEIQSGD
jgi:phospholipase/carboxylesterase